MASPSRIPRGSETSSMTANDPSSSSAASLLSSTAPTAALYNFRLLAALRSANPAEVQPFIDELQNGSNPEASPGRLLGMAVRVATVPIIQQVLSSPSVSSPNLPVGPNTTATPLHVASEIGRPEAVELLLNDPRIDDTIKDDKGRTALECASNSEVAGLIEDSRAALQVRYQSLLAAYVASALSSADEAANIVRFLEQPRVDNVNLNALDERTGTPLLHEAARRRDLRLVELVVKRGGDVFVRDRRGRRALEGDKGADERIKAYLRQFSNQESIVQLKSDGRPPDLKGFLSKWVNYRQGWKTRWFVLENGVLSYYRNREDEQVACRGSIALATAYLHPSSDGTRFEVSSAVTTSVPKIIVKSNLRGEIARWIQAIRLNVEFYQKGRKLRQPAADRSDARSLYAASTAPSAATTAPAPATEKALGSTLNDLPPSDQFLHPGLNRSATVMSRLSAKSEKGSKRSRIKKAFSRKQRDTDGNTTGSDEVLEGTSSNGEDDGPDDEALPHASDFELSMLNLKAQLELTDQLVDSIVTPPSTPDVTASASRQSQVKQTLRESLNIVNSLVSSRHAMTLEREKYLLNRIKREVQARKLWEENLLAVAQQQAETDRQLTEAARDNEKKRRALKQARTALADLTSQPSSPQLGSTFVDTPQSEHGPSGPLTGEPLKSPTNVEFGALPASVRHSAAGNRNSSMSMRNSMSRQSRRSLSIQELHDSLAAANDSDDDDDEFFDAIESGTLPNLRTYDSIVHPAKRDSVSTPEATPSSSAVLAPQNGAAGGHTIADFLARPSLEPYNHVRHRLPIDDDKRPSVSLWSILKSSIGKDLTKISFPVSFNECTSMLQRMAEDMEYDACLTVASKEEDSLKRLAFVAAFAMSNYSSTIGRIAKPFNPMLNQTFEYAIPNRYRYISEQVSHHPPISACYCEAPSWKYYGEVDAKNKFQGRYFEIRPTGVAHAELILPQSFVKPGLKYPAAGPEYPEGHVVEHYSWKKVITNVSNFIMGNPIIDHYGDLVVTNHRTGETCTLTFKPRGWRGANAFEIKGSVADAKGKEQWEIAGRWDSQLIARRAGVASDPLAPSQEIPERADEYMLLWKNTEKPKAPFNLTPYAVTLNDIPQGLENYLCPTDCRLRTDQRAFENAEYDRAQMLKSANEEKQRETRRLRAEGKLPPHEPRWFTAVTDPETGERLWEPKRAGDGEVKFWAEREAQGQAPPEHKWEQVDHIFVDDQE